MHRRSAAAWLVTASLVLSGAPAGMHTDAAAADVIAAPPPVFTRKPPRLTRNSTARFAFKAEGARFQCKRNDKPYRGCESPKVLKELRSRVHRFAVRAVYAGAVVSDPAVYHWRVDTRVPTVRITALRHPGDRTRIRAVWEHSDRGSGVASSDVRWRRTDSNGVFEAWRRPRRWQRTEATRVTLSDVRGGRTYCVAVRVRDRAGNRSAWSGRCLIARRKVRETSEGFRYAVGTSPVYGTSGTLHTYSVEVQRGTNFDANRFTNHVDMYLGHDRGWSRGPNVRFQRVPPSRARIRVLLAHPNTVDRYCAGVANTAGYLSCWNGRFVMVNADRWHHNAAQFDGTLWQYRGYLLNHEVGHALGHRHRSCPGSGRPAPVMMQQSKGTGACRPNPWPYP